MTQTHISKHSGCLASLGIAVLACSGVMAKALEPEGIPQLLTLIVLTAFGWFGIYLFARYGPPMVLRFTIRDLLWLTLVAGVAMGWWVDRTWSRPSVNELLMEVRDLKQQLRAAQTLNRLAPSPNQSSD